MKKLIVAPSLLSANHFHMLEEIHKAEEYGATYIHIDVMDGKFVENYSFGSKSLYYMSKVHKMINDVHIMIEEPLKYAEEYVKSGADILTFHYEVCKDEKEINKVINVIHKNGAKAGLSIKPNTPVEVLLPFLKKLDLVLVMSVEPGLGGQTFIPSATDKIAFLRKTIDENKYKCLIEVDGGINNETVKLVKEAGVDIVVAGSYLFGHDDMKERMEKLQ